MFADKIKNKRIIRNIITKTALMNAERDYDKTITFNLFLSFLFIRNINQTKHSGSISHFTQAVELNVKVAYLGNRIVLNNGIALYGFRSAER